MFKFLFKQSILSNISMALGLLLTYIIVSFLGLEFQGELYRIFAILGLFQMVVIVIPPSFLVIEMQNHQSMAGLVNAYYFIIASFSALLFSVIGFIYIDDFQYYIIYIIANIYLNKYDVTFQSKAEVGKYYMMLIGIALFKIVASLVMVYSLSRLGPPIVVLTYGVCSLVIMALFSSFESRSFDFVGLKNYFLSNSKRFSSYYGFAIVKRLYDAFPGVFFSFYISPYELGLFSLMQKVLVVGGSFIRQVEILLMNKTLAKLARKKGDFAVVIFLSWAITVVFGCVYLLFMGVLNISELLKWSLLLVPLALTTIIRAKNLQNYRTGGLAPSMLLAMTATGMFLVLANSYPFFGSYLAYAIYLCVYCISYLLYVRF